MTHWYKKLGTETFESIFIPLDIDDLNALQKANKANYRGSTVTLVEAELARLKALETKLDEAILTLGGVAFVKLNTRSPKDAVLERKNPRVASIIESRLAKIKERSIDEYIKFLNDDNEQMICVLEAASEAMLSRTGKVS